MTASWIKAWSQKEFKHLSKPQADAPSLSDALLKAASLRHLTVYGRKLSHLVSKLIQGSGLLLAKVSGSKWCILLKNFDLPSVSKSKSEFSDGHSLSVQVENLPISHSSTIIAEILPKIPPSNIRDRFVAKSRCASVADCHPSGWGSLRSIRLCFFASLGKVSGFQSSGTIRQDFSLKCVRTRQMGSYTFFPAVLFLSK